MVLQRLHLFAMMPRLIACEMKLKYANCLSPYLLMFKSILSTWHSSVVILSHSSHFLTGILIPPTLDGTILALFVLFLSYRNMCCDFCDCF